MIETQQSKMLLPVEAYTSQAWFDREQKYLFGRSWQFVGMENDIPEVGRYLLVNAGAYPIIVIRDEQGNLKAFHNICRHRGTQLLEVAGKRTKVIQCPYHDWVYSLDGTLIGVPEKRTEFPDIQMKEWSLFPASVAVWKTMIFVNPDPDAIPFDEYLGDFPAYFGPHQPELLTEINVTHADINANWKIFVENSVDVYHLSHLHSDTLNMYDHQKLTSGVVGTGHIHTYDPPTPEFLKYLQSNPVDYLPLIDHIDPKDWGAFTHLIFPNLIILGTEFSWATIEIIPVSPTMTRVKSRTLTMPLNPITRAIGSGYEKASALLRQVMGYRPEEKPLESGDFFLEDVYACEQQQKAMNSPQFAFGPTSIDKEQLIIDFHRTMMDFMQDKS